MARIGRALDCELHTAGGRRRLRLDIDNLVIAGWTGRDRAALAAHVAELAALGVAPPPRTPMFYRLAAARLTTAPAIEVVGGESSGEVEVVLVMDGGDLYVGVGSDHTDRAAERYDITVAKQVCDKPLGAALWPWDEVRPHWDRLVLRSWIESGGQRELYQEGGVAELLAPDELLATAREAGVALAAGSALYCGTVPAIGGIRPAERFTGELHDPVRGRRLVCGYEVRALHALRHAPDGG
jgi:hypothetical protein